MFRRSSSSRLVLWAAICALVLKSAMPFLAAGAAQARGVAIAEVCTVYGVALAGASPQQDADRGQDQLGYAGHEDRDTHSGKSHSADHCALTALAAVALPDTATPGVAQSTSDFSEKPATTRVALRDAAALWAARLQHGPPPRA